MEAVPGEVKPLQELSDCQDFADGLKAKYGLALCDIANNPEENVLPDCVGRMDGVRVGIEVTRLTITSEERNHRVNLLIERTEAYCRREENIDPDKVKNIRAALAARPRKLAGAIDRIPPADQLEVYPSPPEWSFECFQQRLQAVISHKEEKARRTGENGKLGEFGKLFLLVRTNEHTLSEHLVEEYLRRVEIAPLCHFNAAYMKLSYQPSDGGGYYPVFEIPVA